MEAWEIEVLSMFVQKFSSTARQLVKSRPLLKYVLANDIPSLKIALIEEATREVISHEAFRTPLRNEVREINRNTRKANR